MKKEWGYTSEKSHRNLIMFFAVLRADFLHGQFHRVYGCIEELTRKLYVTMPLAFDVK